MNIKCLLLITAVSCFLFITIASEPCNEKIKAIIRDPCDEYRKLRNKRASKSLHRRHHRQVQIVTADTPYINNMHINNVNNDTLESIESADREHEKILQHYLQKRRHQIELHQQDENEIDSNDYQRKMNRTKRVDNRKFLDDQKIVNCCDDLRKCAKLLCLKDN